MSNFIEIIFNYHSKIKRLIIVINSVISTFSYKGDIEVKRKIFKKLNITFHRSVFLTVSLQNRILWLF